MMPERAGRMEWPVLAAEPGEETEDAVGVDAAPDVVVAGDVEVLEEPEGEADADEVDDGEEEVVPDDAEGVVEVTALLVGSIPRGCLPLLRGSAGVTVSTLSRLVRGSAVAETASTIRAM